jgi:hypothetical protein
MAKSYNGYREFYRDKSTSLQVVAATDDTTLITPKSANHQIFVQRITVGITTYSAKTWTFQDSNGTPVPVWHISIPAAAVALPSESNGMTIDFGAKGFPLTVGTNLVLNVSAAGAAGAVTVEAYEVLVGPVAAASTN